MSEIYLKNMHLDRESSWYNDAYQMEADFVFKIKPILATCDICFENIDARKIVTCQAKTHKFCQDCLLNFYLSAIRDFSIVTLDESTNLPCCPFVARLEKSESHLLLDQESTAIYIHSKVFSQYCKLVTVSKLDTLMTQTIQCLNKKCLEIIILDASCQDLSEINCPYCDYTFCRHCQRTSHFPLTCAEVDFNNLIHKKFANILVASMNLGSSNSGSNLPFSRQELNLPDDKLSSEQTDKRPNWALPQKFKILVDSVSEVLRQAILEYYGSNNLVWNSCKFRNLFFDYFDPQKDLSSLAKITSPADIKMEEIKRYIDNFYHQLNLKFIEKTCISCPYCLTPIHKISGCNDMYCNNCSNNFNYGLTYGNHNSGLKPTEIDYKVYKHLNVNQVNSKSVLVSQSLEGLKGKRKLLPSEKRKLRSQFGSARNWPGRENRVRNQHAADKSSSASKQLKYFL